MCKYMIAGVFLICSLPVFAGYKEGFAAYQKQDYVTAHKEWRLLAEQGDAAAQLALGSMYMRGQGVSLDMEESIKWYRLSANKENFRAWYSLGRIYAAGLGVNKDVTLAYALFSMAEAKGHKESAVERDVLKSKLTPEQVLSAEWLRRSLSLPSHFLKSLDHYLAVNARAASTPESKRNETIAVQPEEKLRKLSDYANKCRLQNEYGFAIALGDTKVPDGLTEAQICKIAEVAINTQINVYKELCDDLVIGAVKKLINKHQASVAEINGRIDLIVKDAASKGDQVAASFFAACKIGNNESFGVYAGGEYSKFFWKIYSVGFANVGGVKKIAYLFESSKSGYKRYFPYTYDSGKLAQELSQKGAVDPKHPEKGGETRGHILRARHGYTGDLPEYFTVDGVQYPYGGKNAAPVSAQNAAPVINQSTDPTLDPDARTFWNLAIQCPHPEKLFGNQSVRGILKKHGIVYEGNLPKMNVSPEGWAAWEVKLGSPWYLTNSGLGITVLHLLREKNGNYEFYMNLNSSFKEKLVELGVDPKKQGQTQIVKGGLFRTVKPVADVGNTVICRPYEEIQKESY